MTAFNPRITPARPDLAARHLQGKVTADRFVDGEARIVIDPQAPLRQKPSHDALLDTEALYGERVTVYEATEEGWCWGQLEADHYVGWLPANALAVPGDNVTHKVIALRTLVFPGPSIKLPPLMALPLGARVTIARMQDEFAVMARGGYLPPQHLGSLDAMEPDFVAVAERFIGTPYLWGGKTALGLDCSALVQVALTACGIPCPRDSDMQQAALGTALPWSGDIADLKRGDLDVLEGPRRHHARRDDATACQRASHGGGDGACDRGHCTDRSKRT